MSTYLRHMEGLGLCRKYIKYNDNTYTHPIMLNNVLSSDTICALATPAGGAIGVIRISGPETFRIMSSIFSRNLDNAAGYTIHYGNIMSGDSVIDEVLVSVFRAPHSYTGEDSVEISCHGSRYILKSVLSLLTQNGARLAHPGEYTKRAFLNGKLDLSQAEAVADLIASTGQASHRMAMSQLKGHFSSQLSQLRDQLLHLTSLLELELDFSDHEELEFADRSELLRLASCTDSHISHLAASFRTGQAIKNGIPVAIIGKTNAGKSTLLNMLLGEERAIVSDIHGTTRDTIEDCVDIGGISFRFIDTAGIRRTTDAVEQIGIKRTYQAMERASIIIWLIDNTPSTDELTDIHSHLDADKALIVVRNKADLDAADTATAQCAEDAATDLRSLYKEEEEAPRISSIAVSAKCGTNIDELQRLIYESANVPDINENDTIVSSARHYDALMQAHAHLQRVESAINEGVSGDLVAEDLHMVLDAIAEITGSITPQDTLNNIFKNFCIGK